MLTALQWQTAFRASAPNVTLAEYFQNWSQGSKAKDAFTAEDIYISYLAGVCEAINGGVTSIVDHAHNRWNAEVVKAGFAAAEDSGARITWCCDPYIKPNINDSAGYKAWRELAASHRHDESLVTMGIGCDLAFDKVEPKVSSLVQEFDLQLITSHFLGGPWPPTNNPENVKKSGSLDSRTPFIFSHGGFITEGERQVLRDTDQFLSITPESEMHYGHGQETSHLIADHACLGIDTAWTFSGDILTQARIWLQTQRLKSSNKTLAKGLIPNANPVDVREAFLLATRQGGLALRRKDIGVLSIGAQADIVVFDCESPNMVGADDPIAAVILHANVGDIKHVMVGGEFRKRDGQLVTKTSSWKEIGTRFKETASRVHEATRNAPPLADGKLFGICEFGPVEKCSTRTPY